MRLQPVLRGDRPVQVGELLAQLTIISKIILVHLVHRRTAGHLVGAQPALGGNLGEVLARTGA